MKLLFDLETNGLLDVVNTIHCMGVKDLDTGESWLYTADTLANGLRKLSEAEVLVGHNLIGFDLPVLRKLHPEWKHNATIQDTLVMSRIKYADRKNLDFNIKGFPAKLIGKHSLEAWGVRLGCFKGSYGGQEGAWEKYTEEMGLYCMQDLEVTASLYEKVSDLPPECVALEQEFAFYLDRQMKMGFMFDNKKAEVLYTKIKARQFEIEGQLSSLFPPIRQEMKTPQYWECPTSKKKYLKKSDALLKDRKSLVRGPNKIKEIPFNINSRIQIADALKKQYGWKPTEFTSDGRAKVDESILKGLDYPEARVLEEYLMLTKRLGMLGDGKSAWMKLVKGNRIHGYINHNGAVSGRCTHSRPNVAQTCSVSSPYGKECRELFTVPTGYKLVGADLSQIELRILAHYTGKWDNKYIDAILSGDIHTVNQQASGLGDHPNGRNMAKGLMYCTLYGGGPTKIGELVGGTAREGKALQTSLLSGMPALGKLVTAVKKTVELEGRLTGLDGRPLTCRSEHSALNTLLQSGASVVMKKATVLSNRYFREQGWTEKECAQVAHIHDEVQVQCLDNIAEEVGEILLKSFVEAGQFFNLRCPLDGDFNVGNNWAETH